jgi:hypothetical protein
MTPHSLLRKLLGRPARAAAYSHFRTAEASTAKLRGYVTKAFNFPETITAAQTAFFDSSNDAALKKWADLEAQRGAMFSISQFLRPYAEDMTTQALADGGRESVLAAVEEAQAELADRSREIEKDDAARAAELGCVVESVAAFEAIARLEKILGEAKSAAKNGDIRKAYGQLFTVIGGPDSAG